MKCGAKLSGAAQFRAAYSPKVGVCAVVQDARVKKIRENSPKHPAQLHKLNKKYAKHPKQAQALFRWAPP